MLHAQSTAAKQTDTAPSVRGSVAGYRDRQETENCTNSDSHSTDSPHLLRGIGTELGPWWGLLCEYLADDYFFLWNVQMNSWVNLSIESSMLGLSE